ncbi:MAG TPA: glycosyltransferase [Actinocrinis sp.]|nr:glycosyltransferase [Actinocrinis sp.]
MTPRARTLTLDPSDAPICVVELELAPPARVRAAGGTAAPEVAQSGQVLALVRLHGAPLGLVQAQVPEPEHTLEALIDAAHADLAPAIAGHLAEDGIEDIASEQEALGARCLRGRIDTLVEAPAVSVVVATRERPDLLERCLTSLAHLEYPRYEVIVVDNAPTSDRTEHLVRERFASTAAYVREPIRGLASAHNRGLAEAQGSVIAFTDDDVIADRDWLAALAEGFGAGPDVGCVTGLIVPAELETRAQVMLESTGAFAKGFTRRHHHADQARVQDPLYPFTAGRLGSGANMAFSAQVLRAQGGFDPAVGAGSIARGGDDLLAFFRTAAAGYDIVYTPDALVWHHHRRTERALRDQAYGYGVGLGAYLTAALVHEPGMVPAFLRRVPRGVVYAFEQSRNEAAGTAPRRDRLTGLRRRGTLYGPLAYLRSRRFARTNGALT